MRWLRSVERDPASTEAHQQLDMVREVLRVAPSLRDLSLTERTVRVAEAFNTAMGRLTSCATQKGYSLGRRGICDHLDLSSHNNSLPKERKA